VILRTADYPNFDSWVVDVFDSALNRLDNKGYAMKLNF
jgi:hypothetical protein